MKGGIKNMNEEHKIKLGELKKYVDAKIFLEERLLRQELLIQKFIQENYYLLKNYGLLTVDMDSYKLSELLEKGE